MHLNYLLYASHLTAPMGFEALKNLLEVSQRNNKRDGLTGFLHIEGQIVLQYLEGPKDALLATVRRIKKDPRHSDFVVLDEAQIDRRFFEGWKMALVENTTFTLVDVIGSPCDSIADVAKVNVMDLVTLLSANSSYLRRQPSVFAS